MKEENKIGKTQAKIEGNKGRIEGHNKGMTQGARKDITFRQYRKKVWKQIFDTMS